jgi:hypothetical protein
MMKSKTPLVLSLLALAGVILCPFTVRANFFDLDFGSNSANPGPNQPAPNSIIGDQYTTDDAFTFYNVAPSSGYNIDLRVTVSDPNGDRYEYLGAFPNYKHTNGATQPNGDLGYLYEFTSGSNLSSGSAARTGGITFNMEFRVGGTNTPFVVPSFRLLMYDVDGESSQSESVRVFRDDGFYGYRLFNLDEGESGITVAEEGAVSEDGAFSYLFTGPGADVAEDNPRGAFVLYFENTSSIRLQMVSRTFTGSGANGVFSAIDGDLSLFGGDDSDLDEAFHSFVPVPEPSTTMLAVAAGLVFSLRGRRRANAAR